MAVGGNPPSFYLKKGENMKLGIKLNLNAIASYTFTENEVLLFTSVTNLDNYALSDTEVVRRIKISVSSLSKQLEFYVTSPFIPEHTLTDNQIVTASTNSRYITFDGIITDASMEILTKWVSRGLIELNQSGKTTMYCYRLNDEKEKLTKSITPVTIIEGKFTAPIGIKTLEIDVVDFDIDNSYNYIFIPKLNRYYYITNIQLTTKDYTKLILQEDVLMSWKSLILQQSAYVTRYGGASESLIIDDRFPLLDEATTTYLTPSMTAGVPLVSFKSVMGTVSALDTTKKPNVFMKVTTSTLLLTDNSDDITAPTGTDLPNIQSKRHTCEREYLININTLGYIVNACLNNEAPSTYIHSALLLPFDLTDIFTDATSGNYIYVGDKALIDGDTWGNPSDLVEASPKTWMTKKGGCPYIRVADFTFGTAGSITLEFNYLDYSPYTLWEIYLPFVGYQVLDPVAVIGKRIQVYYTFDLDTGLSTCYVYNQTDKKVVWSGSCQIGMKLPLAVTNAEELARQKNATTLNLIMGLMSSALSVGVGAYSGNAVAVMGGIMGGAKTIASSVNGYNSLIEKAQITYGSSDNALYSPLSVHIRRTTHRKVLTTVDEQTLFNKINGKPYKKYVALSSLTTGNYIEVGEIHFDFNDENIYNEEVNEIIALLKNGVIL